MTKPKRKPRPKPDLAERIIDRLRYGGCSRGIACVSPACVRWSLAAIRDKLRKESK